MKLIMYFIMKGNEVTEAHTNKLTAEIRCQILNDKAGRTEYKVTAKRLI